MQKILDTTKIVVQTFLSPLYWIINAGVIGVCFLSGPFGTTDALPGGLRLVYWGLIVFASSAMASWLHVFVRGQTQTKTSVWHNLIISALFGVAVASLVLLVSWLLLQPIGKYPGHIKLLLYSFPSAAVIFLLSLLIARSMSKPTQTAAQTRPALLDRLMKFPHASQVLSLSAQDHYVEVTTDIGVELCLLRLNDAIAQVAPTPGFQIHRSHWVAKSAVTKLEGRGTTAQVLLVDGRSLNVSQSRLADFKAFLRER